MLKQICDEFQELNDRYDAVKAELDIFRKYNKYQHGKIYKITNTEDDKVYIGCTSLPLVERMCIHRKKVGTGSMRIHKHMKKLGRDKFTIKLVKEYPTYSQWHLESEEYQVQKDFPDSVDYLRRGHAFHMVCRTLRRMRFMTVVLGCVCVS